ncbi:MAG: Crp/Fnr family transcriptional regulator [Ectothiorhodospiraceae bacterium]|nr:Crp/Fnr family transcriptional regulator [Ectothiorhodospiraceae bacterium]
MSDRPIQYYLDQLKARIDAAVTLPATEWNYAAPHFTLRRFARGEYLARADEVMTHSFHIVEGLVRLFYTTADGREHNKGFAPEGRVVGSSASKILGQPARFDIQALEDTAALSLPFSISDELVDRHPAWERLRRLLLERLFLEKEQREMEFLLCNAQARYCRFMAHESELAKRIPLHHIASYLGMTPVALSRIRRRLKQAH